MRGVLALLLLAPLALTSSAGAAPSRIAFTSGHGIDVMNADGSARAPLLKPRRGLFAAQPAWSPDASRIAYLAGGADSGHSRVWTMAADGSDRRPLGPKRAANTFEQTPAWSPDGSQIAFARTVFGDESLTTSLVVAGVDGGEPRTVVTEKANRLLFLTAPKWSPDGSRLLYTRTALGKDSYFRPALYSIAADGSDRRLVARQSANASFSPDGSAIAFSSTRDHNGDSCGSDECAYNGEIYVAAADGSGARRLTNSKADDDAPAWSPDGARIAFHSDRNYPASQSPEIYSIGADGSCLTWLTNGTPSSSDPAWQPDATGSSDPGGCGATPRMPYLGVDLEPARAFTAATPYWVGPEAPSHLLLSDVRVDGASLALDYDDCSRYRPRECHGILTAYITPMCRRRGFLYQELAASRARRFKHALLLRPGDPGAGTFLVAGATVVDVGAEGIPAMPVVRALRPFDADRPPATLPRAALPRVFWRRVARVERALRRARGDVGSAARALGTRPSRVRAALRVGRALRRLGPFDRLDC